jgi:hypothetical protein
MATGGAEVITRAERRRRWSSADKLRLALHANVYEIMSLCVV